MLTRSAITLALCLSTLSMGCESATKDKPVARGSEAVSATATPAPAAGGTSYKFSNAGSKIEFVGAKVTGKHDGSFGAFSGSISVPGGDATKGTVSVKIEMASMTTDNEKLTTHLKSAEFFDVAKIPDAKFTSTAIKTGGDKGASHTVTGNLELHGVTKSITFPATIKASDASVEVSAEFGINRKDFGIVYPGKPDDLIKDEVLLKLNIKASKG